MKLKLILVLVLVAAKSIVFAADSLIIHRSFRAVLKTPGGDLPFDLELKLSHNERRGTYTVKNGDEHISNTFSAIGDSLYLTFPVFNTVIVINQGEISNQVITGKWYDLSRPGNYFLPFTATKDQNYRFIKNATSPVQNITGRWETIFTDDSGSENTVGIFKQEGTHLSGTFLTTTGDYRFLEGQVSADSFYLSAFDGSHAFLFKGKIHNDGPLTGGWWSGKHYSATFTAKRNENAQLPDPRSLTYLKDGYSTIYFSLPDENENKVSLKDEKFKNKVIILQITGSWCPNCMDETSYLSEVEEKYKNTDLAIIALSFERQPDPINFKKNIQKEKQYFGIEYTFLNAGLPKTASETLPMLNRVMSFPTTIILNKKHEVVEIYTGFSGPATGDVFLEYRKNFEALLDKLLE